MSVVGQAVTRIDGRLKVTGRAAYSADVSLPNQAHAVMVLSRIARGRIVEIDAANALALPGVVDVMTHLNAPRLPQGGRAAVHPPAGRVLSLLQEDAVHYNREPVALVIAETPQQADAAAAMITIRYEQGEARLNFDQERAGAHAPESVNGEAADTHRGDAAGGRDAAARIVQSYRTPMQHHNPLEPHATLASWEDGHLTVYDATQYVSGTQQTLAKIFGIAKERVRVVCPFVGGGFGCKGSTWSHVALAAMAAQRLARPVKLVLPREQMFGPVGGRPQTLQELELSADATGRLQEMNHASFSHTSQIEDFTEGTALQTRIMYDCPNLTTSHRLVSLDVATPTFQRAPGHATGTFALESALDELARALHMDPLELRLRNEPLLDPQTSRPWSSRALRQCYQRGAAVFGWHERAAAARPRSDHIAIGRGVAAATYPANRSAASARVRLDSDGRVTVQSGTQDLGTGTYTIMAQVAADALGYPLARIDVELGDSDLPPAPVSGGSQSAASVLPAVQGAAYSLRDKLIALARADRASAVFGRSVEETVVADGSIGPRASASREPLAAVLRRAGLNALVAESTAQPGAEKQQFSMHSFGAVFVEAHVDRELGVIRVPRVVARYSIGRLLNAKTGRSQLLGGIVWGLGMALMEQSILDPRSGRIVNASLAEYLVPTNADIGEIDVDVVDELDVHANPLGARGIGEIGITGVAAALANALFDATGVRLRELPLTLDKLLI